MSKPDLPDGAHLNMEPELVIPERLLTVLEELRSLEPLYHAAYRGATPQKFEALVAPEFWEIGASGRRYSRAFALSVLAERLQAPAEAAWQTQDFHLAEIAEGSYLLTYTLHQPDRATRRATLWRRSASGGWQAIYHQGTVVAEPDALQGPATHDRPVRTPKP